MLIAQETGDFPPPYITFFNTSKSHLKDGVGKIEEAFEADRSFGGVSLHYINSLMALR